MIKKYYIIFIYLFIKSKTLKNLHIKNIIKIFIIFILFNQYFFRIVIIFNSKVSNDLIDFFVE